MVWSGDIVVVVVVVVIVVVVVVVVPNECYQLLLRTSFQGDDTGPRKRGRKEGESTHKHNYTDLGHNLVL